MVWFVAGGGGGAGVRGGRCRTSDAKFGACCAFHRNLIHPVTGVSSILAAVF